MTRLVIDDDYLEQAFRVARRAQESAALAIANARDTLADLREIRQRTFCLIRKSRERLGRD